MDINMKKAFAIMALMAAPLAAQGAAVHYTDEGLFSAALNDSVVDSFADLDLEDVETPINRTVTSTGGTEYTYLADTQSNVWVLADGASGQWIAVDDPFDDLDFSTFSPNITAIGGYFFNTDFWGGMDIGDLDIKLTDSFGNEFDFLILNAVPTTFTGFTLTEGFIDSLSIEAVNSGTSYRMANFATASNLIFGTTDQGGADPAAVPAPLGVGLLGLGLLGLGIIRRIPAAA